MWKHGLILIQISHKTRLKPKTFTRLSIGWHKVIYGVALAAREREEKFGSICCAVTQPRRGGGKKAKFQYFRGGQIARHQFASAASEKKAHEVGFFFASAI